MKWIIKKISVLTIMLITLTILVGCTGLLPSEPNDNVAGAAPVYQGMVLSDSVQTLSAFSQGTISKLSLFTNLSTTYTENDLKDIIANEMPYENTGEIDHFADLNQDVFITVKLLNPDGQAILRFTLNGVIYQSFQFHAGSDSENLILKVNSGTVSGVKEFTIDEIKYVENGTNDIKDAIFDGDRTIKLGVKHGTLPTAQANNLVHNVTSMSVNANVNDSSALIAEAGDTLKAFLITNNEIFDSTDLLLGDNTIEFSKLSPNTEYVFVIATIIDVLDGNGKHIYLLLDAQSFTTGTLASIDNVVPTQASVTFDITVTDADEVGELTAIELYQGETLIEALTDLSLRTFSDLLSNNTYQIKVTYTYDLNDGLGEQELITTETVTTLAKATPEVVVDNVVPTQDSVAFDITVTDTDEVGAITAIELYQGETLIEALTDLSSRTFSDLVSNNTYQVKVTYTYDLNDGLGEQEFHVVYGFKSVPKQILINTISVLNQQISSGDTVIFSVSVLNPDKVDVKNVLINGMEIALDSTSTTTTLRFRFTIVDEMGIANYIIEGFVLNDETVMDISDNNSIELFVMANIDIQNVIQSDGNYYGNMYDTYNITFNQPIATFISKVLANGVNPTVQVVSSENIIVIDDYTIQVPITSMYNVGTRDYKIVSIEFVIDSVTYNVNLDYSFLIFIVNSGVNYIETVDDLLSMDPYSYELFILNNDIDFTGINWTPINLNGVLLGNGYKFTNITMIDYSGTERFNYAIFDVVNGVISDLYIDNLFISVDKNNSVKIAPLAIRNSGVINNVVINGNIEVVSNETSEIGGITVDNQFLIVSSSVNITIVNSSKTTYIGGITAVNSSQARVQNSSVISSINSSTELTYSSHYVGGLTGYNQGAIERVSVDTLLNVHSSFIYTGGLTGYNHGSIKNSYTKGTVNSILQSGYSYGYSSGFVGYNSQSGSIKNSYSSVDTSIINSSLNWSSGFVGENQGLVENSFSSGLGFNQQFVQSQSGVFKNNYSLKSSKDIQIDGIVYKDSINDIITIINELWDHSIWDFSLIDNIDVTHPILK